MFHISTGEKSIDLNDTIAEAAELYCNRAKSEGDFYSQDRVAHQIGEFLLGLMDDLANAGLEDLIDHRGGGKWDLREKLFKSLSNLEPMSLAVVEEYQDQIAA
jgi:hypothetical protein